ncbi:MAG: NAD-dependent epimerase/dehydratase family protein [Planctomycetota bacterium]
MSGIDLVCGGSGFIGSHIVDGLLAGGCQVRVLDDLSTGYASNLEGRGCELRHGDAADPDTAVSACEGVSRIFHLAARPSVPWSFEQPVLARHANLGTTESLIAAAVAQGVKRIVFSSSSAIYGDSPELPKSEDMQPAPMSPYAEHKLAGEHALAAAAAASGLESVSLRYFNVFGPRQDPSSAYSGVISLFARWLQEGTAPSFYGDGQQTRDFIYVEDVVQANLAAASAELAGPARVLNIARGERISILELWQTMCRIAGKDGGDAQFLEARAGDVRHSQADISKAVVELGFAPAFDLEEGLRRTLASVAT